MQIATHIANMLENGQSMQAIEKLNAMLCTQSSATDRASMLYLLGNVYYKLGDWKEAIQRYMEACELDPASPACERIKMAYSILEFYNKDIYGQ